VRSLRVGIVDASYPTGGGMGLGASWLRWEIETRHTSSLEIIADGQADVLLASVQSQQVLPQLKTALKRSPVRAPVIAIGGPGAYAPVVFGDVADMACVGEGRQWVGALASGGIEAAQALECTWRPGRTDVVPATEFPWDSPPAKMQDGTCRVWWSRGCRRKCLFCQTGWESTYRKRSDTETAEAHGRTLAQRGERVVYVTNDHSDLTPTAVRYDTHGSVTFDGLRAMLSQGGLSHLRNVRVGVEGISERLRMFVRKPIEAQALVDVTADALHAGVNMVWFLIVGLPTETERDYDELRETIMAIKRRCRRGLVRLAFHGFLPHPAAPLSCLPLCDDYWERFDEFRRWFFNGPGATARVQIVPPAKYATRLKQAMANMACGEAQLRAGYADGWNRNVRAIAYPTRAAYLAQVARLSEEAEQHAA